METEMIVVEMVTISKEEYEWLLRRDRFLNVLECNGVDNWDGYEDAYHEACSVEDEDEDEKNV